MKYTTHTIKTELLNLVADAVGQDIDKGKLEITVPPEAEMGDFAVPCFFLSKLLRRSPSQIAIDLASKIHPAGLVMSVKNDGPYLNFFINQSILAKQVLKEINKRADKYGQLNLGKDRIMLEYSQPNTHKEFHIGHMRNAILGSALIRLLGAVGYKVMPVNYIGDVGAHVAKCLWALEKFHAENKLPENKGKYLGQIYTEAVKKTEVSKKNKKEADEVLQKLEADDKKWTALWKKTRKWSLDEFDQIYKILDCKFDQVFYESEVANLGKEIVADLLKKGIAEISEGAVIINLEKYNLKNFLLLKSDGSSLYSTKDIALAQEKFKKYKIDKSIIITDSRQSFYFSQLFKTLAIMGFDKEMIHIPYEFVTLKAGAMSSRSGNVVLFEDFYHQVVGQATHETKKRHPDWSEKKIQDTSRKIALSAIKFNMLKTGNDNIITFDIDEALSFDGFSGPYLQYTCSRISSVLKKAKSKGGIDVEYDKLNTVIEKELMLKLIDYPNVIEVAAKNFQPSELTRYLFELAKLFSNFYQTMPILNSDDGTKKARLSLIFAVKQTIANGLGILGIETMDEM
ncbi:MAG TPA: arginine--tRNA ligase [Patescibacteria group bacterium]|nr:arginine--tRNA ligase [Patescibacteria group bacterium]